MNRFASPSDEKWMRLALKLAQKGQGTVSPNPIVGAVLVKRGKLIGQGWHRKAGGPHAEIVALSDARRRGQNPRSATLYVTLEPCCTHGRTPPCTKSIIDAGISRVVASATDPNPKHAGRGFRILRRTGIGVTRGVLAAESTAMNEAFNHWIVKKTPWVTVKTAMTLDGKIATANGQSKWITGEQSRDHAMGFRRCADAILVGVNTVLKDDPSLTVRGGTRKVFSKKRLVLDSMARTPLTAKVVCDSFANLTTIIVTSAARKSRISALAKHVCVWVAPSRDGQVDLRWLLRRLGTEGVTSLLVEGGGEVNASFLLSGLAHDIAFYYAPKIIGGHDARKAVAGVGINRLADMIRLQDIEWKRLGSDLLLTARIRKV